MPSPSVEPISQPTATTEQQPPSNQPKESDNNWFWPPIWSNWALVIVAGVAAYIALRTLKTIETQTKAVQSSADAAKNAAIAASKQAESIIIAERAYVKMSHSPPGLKQFGDSAQYDIHLRVENFGQTPALITRYYVRDEIIAYKSKLRDIPYYPTDQRVTNIKTHIFLGRDDKFFFDHTIPIDDVEINDIQKRKVALYVYGFVDYIDQFGTRHRTGYGRQYKLPSDGNNLQYILQTGYNYDRPREQGEGNDWETQV